MQLGVVLALAFAVAIAIFAGQNTTPIALNFLFFRLEQVSISVLVLIAAMLGAALTFALGLVREVRHRTERRSLRQQVQAQERRTRELEAQLHQASSPRIAASPGSEPLAPHVETSEGRPAPGS